MRQSAFDLAGKVAVVTGSSRGIGRSIAEHLAGAGAKVVVSSRKPDACEAVARAIRDQGGEAIVVPASIADRSALENLVKRTRERWGRIDICVANAASSPYYGSLTRLPDETFEKTMRNNVLANIWLSNLVIPEMAERRDGSFMIVSSIGAFRGHRDLGAYCISKAADMQLARNLAVEWGPHNVRVNCIAPGLIKTDFARAAWETPEAMERTNKRTPLCRIGEPDDVGGVAVFLA
jgi:NAD(P)-dependent dehydrogenase (short-subunit alcohol dehydrogenase family)